MVSPKSDTIITTAPLTAEAREEWLHDLFIDSLNHYGELFIPRDSFYSGKTAALKAQHMLEALCTWLAIKPGYIQLQFEGETEAKKSRRYSIFIEKHVTESEFLLAATIAIALTRYLLEEKKQVHLQVDEQRSLVTTASVTFGLGVVVANGLQHDHDAAALIGPVPPSEYAAMLHGFFRQRSVATHSYQAYLAPWAAELLHVKKPRRPSRAVSESYARERHQRYQLIGLIWLLLVALGIGGYVISQRVMPESPAVREARQKVDFLRDIHTKCQNSYTYNRQYTDTSDLQAERNLNAEAARCQSLKNELDSATTYYQSLVR